MVQKARFFPLQGLFLFLQTAPQALSLKTASMQAGETGHAAPQYSFPAQEPLSGRQWQGTEKKAVQKGLSEELFFSAYIFLSLII